MKKDILINLIITMGISLTSFIVNKYFAIYLGKEYLGLMKLFTQMLNYLNLVEMGLASAASYALYKPLLKKDYNQVSIIINTISSLYNKIFLFILIIGLGLNPIIPFFIKSGITNKMIYLYWSLYVFSTATSYFNLKYSLLFSADQRYGVVRLIQGISLIVCQILQIVILVKYTSFIIFIVLLIISNIVQFILYKYYYNKNYFFILNTQKKDNSITINLKKLFWHKLSGAIVHNTDYIIISTFVSLEIVGVYSSYTMITGIIITILNIVFNVLNPRIGKLIASHNFEIIFSYFKKLNILFVDISLFFSLTTYFLIDDFIKLWLGNDFVLPNITVILVLINLFLYLSNIMIYIFKQGSGYFDDVHLPLFESGINFIVSIILVQFLSLNGVIIGTICSNFIVISIFRPIYVFKYCFKQDIKEYLKIYSKYLIIIIISTLSCYYIISFIKFSIVISWIDWIYKGIIISILIAMIIGIVSLFDKEFQKIVKYFMKIIKTKLKIE